MREKLIMFRNMLGCCCFTEGYDDLNLDSFEESSEKTGFCCDKKCVLVEKMCPKSEKDSDVRMYYTMNDSSVEDPDHLGKLQFKVFHDEVSRELYLRIFSAFGLNKPGGYKGSNYYVIVELNITNGQYMRKQTEVKRGSTNPIWNESIIFKVTKIQLIESEFILKIINEDVKSTDWIYGELQFMLSALLFDTEKTLNLDIKPITNGLNRYLGQILIGLDYDEDENLLEISIKEVRLSKALAKYEKKIFVEIEFHLSNELKAIRSTQQTIGSILKQSLKFKVLKAELLTSHFIVHVVKGFSPLSIEKVILGSVNLSQSEVEAWNSLIYFRNIVKDRWHYLKLIQE